MKSKSRFITETSHVFHEIYYMIRHYSWVKTSQPINQPMLIFMVNDLKGFYVGGMVDRFKGIISTYAWCKQRNINFRIRHIFPFELADYLKPARYDWRLRDGEYNTCIWNASLMRARGEYGRRLVRTKLNKKQIHYYGNRDFLSFINETGNTNYTWGELFNELFSPSEKLEQELYNRKKQIGETYISAVFRFQNLLGDFKEYGYTALDADSQEVLITKCINGLLSLQKKYPDTPILVTSDSGTFINRISNLFGIYTIGGERVHIGCVSDANYDTYLGSFIDFYMLIGSQRIFNIGTKEMYPTAFPLYAAKVLEVPFDRILLS